MAEGVGDSNLAWRPRTEVVRVNRSNLACPSTSSPIHGHHHPGEIWSGCKVLPLRAAFKISLLNRQLEKALADAEAISKQGPNLISRTFRTKESLR